MKFLQISGSWDQEIDSWFTNHEPLIPTLYVFSNSCLANCWRHKLYDISSIIYSSNGWQEETEGEREIQTFEYLENEKSF